MSFAEPVLSYGRMIRFSHSIFALPFALSGAALAAAVSGIQGAQIGWIVVAMVAARSAAMGFNRLVDRHIDARNPRTAQRELPRGVLSPPAVWLFVILSALGLIGAAWKLNPLCLVLSPVALFVIGGYSFTKRFTWGSHLVLGLGLGLAPLGRLRKAVGRPLMSRMSGPHATSFAALASSSARGSSSCVMVPCDGAEVPHGLMASHVMVPGTSFALASSSGQRSS